MRALAIHGLVEIGSVAGPIKRQLRPSARSWVSAAVTSQHLPTIVAAT